MEAVVAVVAAVVAMEAIVEVVTTPTTAGLTTTKGTLTTWTMAPLPGVKIKTALLQVLLIPPPANIYAQDTHAIEPVLVNNRSNSDNASVESSLFSCPPCNGSAVIHH
jgi:hypothetical protein